MAVRPVKTQISLGIRPHWSESSLSAWRKLGSLATHWAYSKDWSDWADAQADLNLRWAAHSHFVGFVVRRLKYCWRGSIPRDVSSSWTIQTGSLYVLQDLHEDHALQAFSRFDTDSNGYISAKDFEEIMISLKGYLLTPFVQEHLVSVSTSVVCFKLNPSS